MSNGPLAGVRVVEVAGLGPGPFCGLLLADMGADVICLDRIAPAPAGEPLDPAVNVLRRGRRSVRVDLKRPEAVDVVLDLVERADAVFEPFRPGVADRLGIGPLQCFARNPRLVYGRLTGWGQHGPYAAQAGHDINYIALAGALAHCGRPGQPPSVPWNLLADMGGGGLLMAYGLVCALLESRRSGQGQVIDAAMVDGVASLMSTVYTFLAMGTMSDEPGTNTFDGGAHFYDVYACADGKFISIGAVEPQFYAELVRVTGLDDDGLLGREDASRWPVLKERLAETFRTGTRDEWCARLEGNPNLPFAPVLTMTEAAEHPHNKARGTFVEVDGVLQPAPAPRLSRTPGSIQRPPPAPGQHTDEVLREWLGTNADDIDKLRAIGAVA